MYLVIIGNDVAVDFKGGNCTKDISVSSCTLPHRDFANRADPDQTALVRPVRSGSTLFAYNMIYLILHKWIICVIYVLCLSCFPICSLLPCVHLLGKG